jgi:integration host factor subunit alpha
MTITKKHIASKLSKKINNNETLYIVDGFFNSIKQALINGENVNISSFGNFIINEKSARIGRNPKTGEKAVICARKVVIFKAGPKFKKIINNKNKF